MDFVEDYHLKELFAEGKAELNGLWRHYRPRKATGYLQFGTGDPALTGELTGILYLLLPAVSEVQLEPDFNDAMLQMELRAVRTYPCLPPGSDRMAAVPEQKAKTTDCKDQKERGLTQWQIIFRTQ